MKTILHDYLQMKLEYLSGITGKYIGYYIDSELCWNNYCSMLNTILMTLDCLVSNPFPKIPLKLNELGYYNDFETIF